MHVMHQLMIIKMKKFVYTLGFWMFWCRSLVFTSFLSSCPWTWRSTWTPSLQASTWTLCWWRWVQVWGGLELAVQKMNGQFLLFLFSLLRSVSVWSDSNYSFGLITMTCRHVRNVFSYQTIYLVPVSLHHLSELSLPDLGGHLLLSLSPSPPQGP